MIISFDIWDTILKRKCHPEEIKLATARYIVLKYNADLKDEYKNIYKILKARDTIEEKECKRNKEAGFDAECRILDVFKLLQKEIMKNDIDDISQELLKEEIEQEKKSIFINPDVLPIFEKYKDLKMYCISDFYMSSENLKELLDYVKIPVVIEKIYSSADYLLNKRTGNLYKIAEEELGITSSEHIHVGDNQLVDIDMAKSLGIETIKLEKTEFNFMPQENRKYEYNLEQIKTKDVLYNAGIDLAPLLYFFVYSIIEYAIKNKIPTIYYQTREGETFIKIHQMIEKNNPFGVEIPKCEILEVSRMATFSASLKELSIKELLRLWSQYTSQSMYALFKTLAIDIKKYELYFEKYNIDINQKIDDPWKDEKIKKLFSNQEFVSKVNFEINLKREELLKFFSDKKKIVNDDKSMFLVDIGWRGTIQDNLAYIFNNKKIGGYYLTLYDFYNEQPKNVYKLSYIDDVDIRDNELGEIITLLEWIYNPGTGSVIEYKDGNAIRKAKTEELDVVNKYIKPLQNGMFAGAEIINEYMKYHPYEASESKNEIYNLIKQVKTKPDKALIEAYYSMVFNDTFGTSEYVEKDLKLTFFQRLNIFKCRNMLRNENWKEAFIIYNNLGYLKLFMKIKSIIRKLLGKG